MVVVVGSQGNRVALDPVARQRLRPTDTTGLAAGIAKGLGELSGQVMDAAELRAQIEAEQDDREAKQALINWDAEASTLVYDPNEGAMFRGGKAALDAYTPTTQALRTKAREAEDGLTAPRAKALFKERVTPQILQFDSALARHTAVERSKFDNAQTEALVSSAKMNGGAAWQDPDLVEQYVLQARDYLGDMARRPMNGWSEEQLQQERLRAESDIRTDVATRMIDASVEDAEAWYRQHEGGFTPDQGRQVSDRIRVQRARNEAEARRQQAEVEAQAAQQRREQREQLDTLRVNLDAGAGGAADWEALAIGYEALDDSSSAASARLRAGETRVTEQYRGASLSDIDGRINELTAQTAGKGLVPDQAAELNGLRKVRDQTKARLDAPGGLMAQLQLATGQQLAPLSDDASFQRRANTALAAARRYGSPSIEPLTEAELPQLRALVAGNSAERTKALEEIARFRDPRAIRGAAKQVAGADDGAFRIASTLMLQPGGSMNARDVLRGADAQRTNPDAFRAQEARLLFNQYAGPALAGMPDYAGDVFDAAKSLYFARTTRAGGTAWSADAFRTAVATVTGQYRNGQGQVIGGFTRVQGVPVSLPSGWTHDGLMRRIARGERDDLIGASINGSPVWPDGTNVSLGQIRQLIPVRLGETVYGFRDKSGAGLVQSKNVRGQPYTIDVTRLPWK
ncbi:hypothetical protein [Sphingomonas qomolangmaensis]|uniref:Uncharacterized protein n=1 Tax=Sphingomonas qomolangmaensis TaxID=2918765 RepID=A0ABY5L901_9SPHN|nr:hypothetical protein [Sphingomonas qomolangmaensis]UUL83450.1 hypothetical protein NMP03_04265 [Sphingomonas qomolangmaensis]